jgi:hypothetical protein
MSRRLHDGWPETYTRLSTRDPADLTPDQLEDLAEGAWLVCRLDESLSARRQVYARYHEIHDDRSAARTAWRLFWDHLYNGDKAVALGWLRRETDTWPRSRKVPSTASSRSASRSLR